MSPLARNPLGNFNVDNRLEDRTVPATPTTAIVSDLSFLASAFGQNALTATKVDDAIDVSSPGIDVGQFEALVVQVTGEPALGGRVPEAKSGTKAAEKKPDTGKLAAPLLYMPPDIGGTPGFGYSIALDADLRGKTSDLTERMTAEAEARQKQLLQDLQRNPAKSSEPPKKIEPPKPAEQWKDPFDALDRGQRLPPLVSSADMAKLLLHLNAEKQADGGGQQPKKDPAAKGGIAPKAVEPKDNEAVPAPSMSANPNDRIAPAPRPKAANPQAPLVPEPAPPMQGNEGQQMRAAPEQPEMYAAGSNTVTTTVQWVALAFAASLAYDGLKHNKGRRNPTEAAFV